ncbi:MAG: hypothetical protein ABSB88_18005 [Bryobacteraceae bacterium]|jgi:hypothetical protein
MRYWLLLFSVVAAFGQGTEPKPKPEDYEVHASTRAAAIGAEYMVHSFSRGDKAFLAKDYLVVEVAVFPPKGGTIEVHNADFTLRINGKKAVMPEAVSMVAASLQHPEWEQPRPNGEIDASAGNAGVVIGGPPRNPNPFPGSNPPGSQLPPRVEAPKDNPSGVEKEQVKAEVVAVETALVEGPHHAAFSGFLYFVYRAKPSSVKTLELLYQDAVLKLK